MNGPRFNQKLLQVPLYIAGRSVDEVKEELGLSHITKLASNENPLGPSPAAVQAASAMLQQAHRYPGVLERDLRRKLARRCSQKPAAMRGATGRSPLVRLEADGVVIGNGGTDVLRLITQAFVFDGGNTVMSRVSFPMYRILTTMFGGEPRIVEAGPEGTHDLDAMLEMIDDDTRVVFLCSPNNPTGQVIMDDDARAFVERVPERVVVVFDESYFDYKVDAAAVRSIGFIGEGRNVISVRSFSKTGGLANLRLGYMYAPARLANYVEHAKVPFHVGDVALAAAMASLDDDSYLEEQIRAVEAGRTYLVEAIRALGLDCMESQANFVLFFTGDGQGAGIVEELLRSGFIVREMTPFGLPDAIRVTVGRPVENSGFVTALEQVMAQVS